MNSRGAPVKCWDAIADGSITITVGGHYPADAAKAPPIAGPQDSGLNRPAALS